LYIVPPPSDSASHLFSEALLQRRDFQKIFRLAWAQEVSGSDPDAPTNLSTTDHFQSGVVDAITVPKHEACFYLMN
jgi:hypothetical protein